MASFRESLLKKLNDLDVLISDQDMLSEFILVLLANGKSSEEMQRELEVFLDGPLTAKTLVEWIFENYSNKRLENDHSNDTSMISDTKTIADTAMALEEDVSGSSRRIFSRAIRDMGRRPRSRSPIASRGSRRHEPYRYNYGEDGYDERRSRKRRGGEKNSTTFTVDLSTGVRYEGKGSQASPTIKSKIPCHFFPACKHGSECPFFHPSLEPQKPLQCKFNLGCKNPACSFVHSSPASSVAVAFPSVPTSNIPCKYFPWCSKGESCSFFHPTPVPCRYNQSCARLDCIYLHPTAEAPSTPCKFGLQCARPFCQMKHPEGHFKSSDYSMVENSKNSTAAHSESDSTNKSGSLSNVMISDSPPTSPFNE